MSEQQVSSIRQAPKIPRGKLLKRLWQYLGRYRLLLVLAMILVILTNALSLAGPTLSGLAIDAIGISAVVRLLQTEIGKCSAAEMTEDELVRAMEVIDGAVSKALGEREDRWRKNWAEAEERDRWNAQVEKRKADRQSRRNEKKVSG